jgi:hypothetical protein
MVGYLLMRLGTVLSFFGSPSTLRIPGTVREIGDEAFSHLSYPRDLIFEEGTVYIRRSAFYRCSRLKTVAFPASLRAIEASAFDECVALRYITFPVASELESIGREAFAISFLEKVLLPEGVREIDPSAFYEDVWRELIFEGQPLFFIFRAIFLCSVDAPLLLRGALHANSILIASGIKEIGPGAFTYGRMATLNFESESKLRGIGSNAFSHCELLTTLAVPKSVETIGDGCFEHCSGLPTVAFEELPKLKRIGGRAFAECMLNSIN